MLDRLTAKLVLLVWLFSLWERLSPSQFGSMTSVLLLGGLILFFLLWVLGALANAPAKSHRTSPYDRLHESPRGGFSAWDQEPEGGLRPPAALRWIVMTFGRRASTLLSVVEIVIFFGALATAWLLSRHSEAIWAQLPSWFAQRSSPQNVFLIASAVIVTSSIRSWAVGQRDRLVPSTTPHSLISAIVFLVAFAAFVGMMIGDLFEVGPLWGAVGGIGLVALAILPPWRSRSLDILFGKRDQAAS